MPTQTHRPAAYSIPEAARQLSISRSGLYQLIDAGKVRRVKLNGRALIPASEITRLLEPQDSLPEFSDDIVESIARLVAQALSRKGASNGR